MRKIFKRIFAKPLDFPQKFWYVVVDSYSVEFSRVTPRSKGEKV